MSIHTPGRSSEVLEAIGSNTPVGETDREVQARSSPQSQVEAQNNSHSNSGEQSTLSY